MAKVQSLENLKFKTFIQQNAYSKIGNPQLWTNDGKSTIKAENENRKSSNAGQDRFVAILSLTPYMNKWTIQGNTKY